VNLAAPRTARNDGDAFNVAHLGLDELDKVVDVVHEIVAELWVWCSGWWCGKAHARAWLSNGDSNAALALASPHAGVEE
jgi:hypothetical protein